MRLNNFTRKIVKKVIKKESVNTYKTKFKLSAIPKSIRSIICSVTQQTSSDKIDFRSNLSRLEYELHKFHPSLLQGILKDLPVIHKGNFHILENGFIIHFNDKLTLYCRYLHDGDRLYKIVHDQTILFEKTLDCPKAVIYHESEEDLDDNYDNNMRKL